MARTHALVVLVAAAALVAVPAATVATPTATPTATSTDPTDANATVAPGAQLSGAVSVGQAELHGDVEQRAYGISVAEANTDRAKADVVDEQLSTVERRMDRIEQRKQALQRARVNGSMSEDEYRAKMAAVYARTQNVQRMANATQETASGLPADVLREKGVNVTAIRTLQTRANELTGPEVAAIARTIAGRNAGEAPGRARGPGTAGPGDERPGGRSADAGQTGGPSAGGAANATDAGTSTDANATVSTDGDATATDRSGGGPGR